MIVLKIIKLPLVVVVKLQNGAFRLGGVIIIITAITTSIKITTTITISASIIITLLVALSTDY